MYPVEMLYKIRALSTNNTSSACFLKNTLNRLNFYGILINTPEISSWSVTSGGERAPLTALVGACLDCDKD